MWGGTWWYWCVIFYYTYAHIWKPGRYFSPCYTYVCSVMRSYPPEICVHQYTGIYSSVYSTSLTPDISSGRP